MKKMIIISGLLLWAATLPAQEEVLTIEQCRDMALQNNKQIVASAWKTRQALYTARSYKGNFFPDVKLNGTGLYSTVDGSFGMAGGNLPVLVPDAASGQLLPNGSYAYFPGLGLDYKVEGVYGGGISVEQPIYMGGKIRSAYKMAKMGKEMAQMNEELTAVEVILATDCAYAALVKAKEMRKVADSYRVALAELLRNVTNARKHGLAAQNEVLKVQVKLNEAELSVRRAANAVKLAGMNLCHYIGRPLTDSVCIAEGFPQVDEAVVQTSDISARPEYGILDRQTAIAHQQVKLTRSELLPQVGVRGSYDYYNGLKLNGQKLLDKGAFTVLLNVSIPITHFGERIHKVRAAKAQAEQVRMEQQDKHELMQLELMQAANNLDEARLECQLADRALVQAEENRRVSRKQYEVGLETLSDHLEAQALWQQAYQTQVDAHFQLYVQYVAYLKASGKLL